MEDILVKFGNYGFPMVVAVYLLVRVEKKIEALTGAIHALEQTLARTLSRPPAAACPLSGDTGEAAA